MQATTRSKVMMGRSALRFSRAHPDDSAGYTAAVTKLGTLLDRAAELAQVQQEGFHLVREATALKRDLRTTISTGHLHHLTRVARAAAVEMPAMPQRVVFKATKASHLAFVAAATEAMRAVQEHKDQLVAHGLSEPVLADLERSLARFEAAMAQDEEGRSRHIGATAKLLEVADAIVDVVHTMDGINRLRFAGDAEALAQWASASSIAVAHRAATGGEAKPAA